VFAHNGVHYSAPGFISYFCPPCEKRVYDAEHRIVSIEHVAGQDAEHYSDPMLMTPGIWKDVFHYDAEGHPLGWTRTQKDSTSEFTQFGTLVVDKDDQGRPMKSQGVIYLRQQANPQSWPELHEQPIPRFLLHKYASPEDRVGEVEGIDNTAI